MAFMDIRNPKPHKTYLQIREEVRNRFKSTSTYPSRSFGARPLPYVKRKDGGQFKSREEMLQAHEDWKKKYHIK